MVRMRRVQRRIRSHETAPIDRSADRLCGRPLDPCWLDSSAALEVARAVDLDDRFPVETSRLASGVFPVENHAIVHQRACSVHDRSTRRTLERALGMTMQHLQSADEILGATHGELHIVRTADSVEGEHGRSIDVLVVGEGEE